MLILSPCFGNLVSSKKGKALCYKHLINKIMQIN